MGIHMDYPCTDYIAEYYQVPSTLVQAILKTEGGKPGQIVGPNRNKTYDYGPMQINSIWIKELSKMGVTEHELINNACTNIAVGTWILAKRYEEFDHDWVKAIKSYNAGYILKNGEKYAIKVLTYWSEILENEKKIK